jgi:hypothetical protein
MDEVFDDFESALNFLEKHQEVTPEQDSTEGEDEEPAERERGK